MKKAVFTLILSALVALPASAGHDIVSLSSWGPYSKEYHGIAHIDDIASGVKVEFCMVPGQYRRNVKIPSALFESDVHPWYVSPDMRQICYRQEIEWKDKVYADVCYNVMDGNLVMVETRCVNNTDLTQNVSLQLAVRKSGGESGKWNPEISEGQSSFILKYPEVEVTENPSNTKAALPIAVGSTIVLKDIYFEFDKNTLLQQSYKELVRLIDLLRENPKMKIEIQGHTDNQGSASYNQRLSEQRAKAVVDYLVGHGIEAKRLSYKGYGKESPIADNATEEGRATNRRVAFKVISK